MGMAACLVVVLGVYLVRYQVEKDSDSPFSGILPDSSANNSVGANEDTFSDEVTPSDGGLTFASGGTERQEPSDPADYVLIGCPELWPSRPASGCPSRGWSRTRTVSIPSLPSRYRI